MEALNAQLKLVGRTDILRVSATDVQERPSGCGLYGALKVRPDVKSSAWSRRSDRTQTFILGLVREIACHLHEDPRISEWHGLQAAIRESLSLHSLHPGLAVYASHAIENYIEAHDSITAEVGDLRFRCFDPQARPEAGKTLTTWAPVYEDGDGLRELRKLRFGSAVKPSSFAERWAAVSAHVASLLRPMGGITRIRVVEIGLLDASIEVLFDGSPEMARTHFTDVALPDLTKVTQATTASPGYSCKDCKIAGCCSALEKLDGFLGQAAPGHETRSVSARDIEVYDACASQWHLSLSHHLPKQRSSGPASERGRLVHHWIATAHSRSRECSSRDLGAFDSPESFTSSLTPEEYESVREYLVKHVENCPLTSGTQLVSIEPQVYGYDAPADVIIASNPDMIYVDAKNCLVIRETKTTASDIPKDKAEAFDRFFASAWLLNLYASGYRGPYEGDAARFELEVISPTESRVFVWDMKDERVLRMAKAEVRHRTKSWHKDSTWATTPGKHCSWCPVQRWCPDGDRSDEDNSPQDKGDEPTSGLPGYSIE
ncbi:PD-(D/E)XK nuclease family protein [Streptomyces sp. NPDC094458]|uniref:PD-(D/E)XK nuclease family protein n=1 Tax=Streptomyces sp. NPDC094458 TaxID=3155208 RepID=UPI00331768F7